MSIITEVSLLKKRRTKIIATIGPASQSPLVIRDLIEAGANVFRLNMSHGDHKTHKEVYELIREVATELSQPIAILADLCGPKIRTGKFEDGQIELNSGDKIVVTTRQVIGTSKLIPSQYEYLADDVVPGSRILLSDGELEFQVEAVDGTEISCRVVYGGVLKNHKGINLPGVSVSAPSLTDKDKVDADFALQLGVDFLALSFVRSAEDIIGLKKIITESGKNVHIIAKIEKPEALIEASNILDEADGIMVARGDLGVELLPEQVPVAQSQLIDLAKSKFKPVIVATQMLESMISNARPTRAEVTDIAHAVTLGTDAVMLSAETAAGAFPVETVEMMDRIARQTESYLWKTGAYGDDTRSLENSTNIVWDVIAGATANMSKQLSAHAVLVISQSGMSAATMSSARPAAPIVAITSHADVCRKISLLWGVIPVIDEETGSTNPNELARRVAKEQGLADSGDYVLLIRGFHSDPKFNTPTITTITV
jgi:pyruvate kinase